MPKKHVAIVSQEVTFEIQTIKTLRGGEELPLSEALMNHIRQALSDIEYRQSLSSFSIAIESHHLDTELNAFQMTFLESNWDRDPDLWEGSTLWSVGSNTLTVKVRGKGVYSVRPNYWSAVEAMMRPESELTLKLDCNELKIKLPLPASIGDGDLRLWALRPGSGRCVGGEIEANTHLKFFRKKAALNKADLGDLEP